jgi:hypothetical protein
MRYGQQRGIGHSPRQHYRDMHDDHHGNFGIIHGDGNRHSHPGNADLDHAFGDPHDCSSGTNATVHRPRNLFGKQHATGHHNAGNLDGFKYDSAYSQPGERKRNRQYERHVRYHSQRYG